MPLCLQNFKTILEYEPGNIQANHNLCVVYVEMGDLHRAEKCLLYTHNMAPSEDYIMQHLNIVRNRIKLAQVQHLLIVHCLPKVINQSWACIEIFRSVNH